MSKNKYKILKIVTSEEYYIEMMDDERTEINGWKIDEVIKNWFEGRNLDAFHATRDGSRIQGTKKLLSVSFMTPDDYVATKKK